MFDHERTLAAFTLDYARKLSDGVDDAAMADLPAPDLNHPAWVLGHLAIADDYALGLLGRPNLCRRAWHARFGPGTTATADRSAYPGKAELLDAVARGREAVIAASAEADPARMAETHALELAFLRESIPTVGGVVAHIMTTHAAFHLGQFSTWRRLRGLPGVLRL